MSTPAWVNFCHKSTMYSVYPDNAARSLNNVEFVRREDGTWFRKDGVALEPSLQAEFQKAYASLTGQATP